ncbi:MAG: hypothetical protein AAGU23_07455 [Bacillota bacterium]
MDKLAGFRFLSLNYTGYKGALSMEQEQFQKLVLDKLDNHDQQFDVITQKLDQHDQQFESIMKRLEKSDKFQDMALEYMAKMTQELVGVKGEVAGIKDGQRKLAILIENDIKPKIDAIFEKLAIHDDEIAHLKKVK